MQNINEFRLVGKILGIGEIFTYPNGTQILVCNIQTTIDGETMNHSVNFYGELAHHLRQTAIVGQQINIDGNLMAIEYEQNGKVETYFGLKAKYFYLLVMVQLNTHLNATLPPQPQQGNYQKPNTRHNQQQHSQTANTAHNQQQRSQTANTAHNQQQRSQTANTAHNQQQRSQTANTAHNQQQHKQTANTAHNQQQRTQTANTAHNQQPQNNNDNWADDIELFPNSEDQQNQNEAIELVAQKAIQNNPKVDKEFIGGVAIDVGLPFIKK